MTTSPSTHRGSFNLIDQVGRESDRQFLTCLLMTQLLADSDPQHSRSFASLIRAAVRIGLQRHLCLDDSASGPVFMALAP